MGALLSTRRLRLRRSTPDDVDLLTDLDSDPDVMFPELGYRIRKPFWGKGYATEGSAGLIDRAFAELGATRVVAETMVVHTASRRVMEKVGMRLVRTFFADWPDHIPGDEHGDVEYAITRAEWASGSGRTGCRGAAISGSVRPAGAFRRPGARDLSSLRT